MVAERRHPAGSSSPEAFDDISTVLRPRVELEAAALRAAFRIQVTDGPDAGAEVIVDGELPSPLIVGSGPASGLRLTDRLVSRRHLSLEVSSGELRLVDLGSLNGTFVGALRVVDAVVPPTTQIKIGQSSLSVTRAASVPERPRVSATRFERLIGESPAMRRLYPLCERLAAVDVPVLIEGETGTGKEVLAESMHLAGPRRDGPFVVFDCTAVPPNLVESELFGHERGSFTGAVGTRRGVFERAHGGTLLIDEIGDLELSLQPKLLRAIERGEVQRLGGDGSLRVDVRILAATRRDLDKEVQAGRFRDDLFHRLVVARIELPPLRRRREDIRVLGRHFALEQREGAPEFPSDVLERWERSQWPGNVRELRNAVARYLALGDLAMVGEFRPEDAADRAPDWIDEALDPTLPLAAARQRVVDEFERRYVAQLLERYGGSVTRAAAAAGVAKRYFQLLKAKRRS
jgi:DNA-binding NtrC family response regulator